MSEYLTICGILFPFILLSFLIDHFVFALYKRDDDKYAMKISFDITWFEFVRHYVFGIATTIRGWLCYFILPIIFIGYCIFVKIYIY